MTDGKGAHPVEPARETPQGGVAASLALWAGLLAAVLAAGALWASEGASIFVQNAFAALAACL